MIGAIIGDIVGSKYEYDNKKTKDIEFFEGHRGVSDDSIMTIAIAKAIMACEGKYDVLGDNAIKFMQDIGRRYPHCGYGRSFIKWMFDDNPQPYNSCGNGSAMRVSAVGFAGHSVEEVMRWSRQVTEVTHNHPEGIKGAEAIAVAVYMAKMCKPMDYIRDYILENYYDIDFTLDEIREGYTFSPLCQDTVPQAFQAFFEAESFADAIRNAVSIGGDSDTIAAMTGSLAEAFFGVPKKLRDKALSILDKPLRAIVEEFDDFYGYKCY